MREEGGLLVYLYSAKSAHGSASLGHSNQQALRTISNCKATPMKRVRTETVTSYQAVAVSGVRDLVRPALKHRFG